MTIQIDHLSVWLPGRGTVLADLSLELMGVTLVAGRSGRGASTLLAAIAGRLPAGARIAGDIRCEGEVLLLDQPACLPAERLDPDVTVVWADHRIECAADRASHVLELIPPERWTYQRAVNWIPQTLPAPPQVALARALGLPRESWWDSSVIKYHLRDWLSSRPRPRGEAGACIGVVSLEGDREAEVRCARTLCESLRPTLGVPTGVRLDRLIDAWERRHACTPGTVLEHVADIAMLDLTRSARDHSTGERAALAWGLARAGATPRLLVEPTLGLDAMGRRHIARSLHNSPRGTTVLLSSDIEVLTRACHRLVVISGSDIVADGAPLAALSHLPAQATLAQLGLRAVRVSDVVAETEAR
jgi:energy-coupling factor transporter ATP-binding protein EcfA2